MPRPGRRPDGARIGQVAATDSPTERTPDSACAGGPAAGRHSRDVCPTPGEPVDFAGFAACALHAAPETWPRGRRHSPAKGACGQKLHQGFESLRLRRFPGSVRERNLCGMRGGSFTTNRPLGSMAFAWIHIKDARQRRIWGKAFSGSIGPASA